MADESDDEQGVDEPLEPQESADSTAEPETAAPSSEERIDPRDDEADTTDSDSDATTHDLEDTAETTTEDERLDEDADTESEEPNEDEADSEGEEDEEDDETTDESANDTDAKTDDESTTLEAKTDGEGYVGERPDRDESEVAYPDPDEDIGGISTPPDDQEMPLADHIQEMIMRLARVLLIGAAATAIGLLWASEAIEFIWFNVFPEGVDEPPHVYHPLELWLTRIKVAALLGIMAAVPWFVWECYQFMKPGLYPHERKYYKAAVPTSVVLAGIGMLFSFIVVLPLLFRYFTFYSAESAQIAYALGETFDLVLTLTGFLAIVFQIPLFVILAVLLGVTTRTWLTEKRLYFWAAFAGLSFMFTMDPTFMAPIIVAIVMIILFEGTLLLLKWAGRE